MERGASPLSSVSYNLRLSIQGCLLEVFSWEDYFFCRDVGREEGAWRGKILRRNVRGYPGGFSLVFTLNG